MSDYDSAQSWRHTFVDHQLPLIVASLNLLEPKKQWRPEEHREPEDRYQWPRLVNGDGERICLQIDAHKQRITVSGTYGTMPDGRSWLPRDASMSDESPSMDANKNPRHIAADIARRMLPFYRVCLQEYRDAVQKQTRRHSATEDLTQQIVSASKGVLMCKTYSNGYNTSKEERIVEQTYPRSREVGISYGSIRVSDTWVRIDLSVSPELALRFAAFLGTLEGTAVHD